MGRRATNNVHTPQVKREPLKCPTCNSINTKFCYYNNYSRSQPRHFCKACRRHWTNGGALRNVPIGGTHKNKRSRASAVVSNDAAVIRTGEAFQPFAHEFIYQAPHHQPRDSVAPSLPFSAGSVMMGACLDAPPPLLASGLVRQEVPIAEEVGASSIWQGLLLQGGGMELWPSVGIGGEESSEHLIGWDGSTQELLREADPSF